jgi:hypothetical protein
MSFMVLGQEQQQRGNGATAMIDRFQSCCNGDGDGDGDRSIAITITMGLGQGHWGTGALGHWGKSKSNCNCNGSNGNGATIDRIVSLYVVLQRKTSTIVVVKNVQNVWMTNIPDVLCWIKTGPF